MQVWRVVDAVSCRRAHTCTWRDTMLPTRGRKHRSRTQRETRTGNNTNDKENRTCPCPLPPPPTRKRGDAHLARHTSCQQQKKRTSHQLYVPELKFNRSYTLEPLKSGTHKTTVRAHTTKRGCYLSNPRAHASEPPAPLRAQLVEAPSSRVAPSPRTSSPHSSVCRLLD